MDSIDIRFIFETMGKMALRQAMLEQQVQNLLSDRESLLGKVKELESKAEPGG